jgi:UPF0755 protein
VLKGKIFNFIINAILIFILLGLGYVYYSLFIYKNKSEVTLYFPYGTSAKAIASTMKKADVIDNSTTFVMATQFAKLFKKHIISGEYQFEAGATPHQSLKKLIKGERVLRKLTAVEGLTVKTILELVSNAPGLTGEITESVHECNLLPETYSYYYGDKANSVVHEMKAAFNKAAKEVMENNLSGLKTFEEVVVLASMVEKETRLSEERPKVAGVYLNRLKIGMPLQADPTVIYGMSAGTGTIERPLTRADLKVDSPYNTYIRKGLPPTAIACPGASSLMATAHPENHEYLYFVANAAGGHAFSKNLSEHNKNNAARKAVEAAAKK